MNHSRKCATIERGPKAPVARQHAASGSNPTFGLDMLGAGGLGYYLFSLPSDLYLHILRLAIMPRAGPMTVNECARENRISWETLAALRLTRKPKPNARNGLNALFYEATLRRWTNDECLWFLRTKPSFGDFERMYRTLHAMRHATATACGADNAAWKRALTAYKSYHQKHQNKSMTV